MKTEINSTETIVEISNGNNPENNEPMFKRWTMRPDQAVKHLPQFTDSKQPIAERLSAGDVSAIRDAANEYKKQRDS